MANLDLTLNLLEEKIADLQRDTKFCVNNYDYHHKNNERQILENLAEILKDSLKEGREFFRSMAAVRSNIIEGRKKCSEVDELLKNLGYKAETTDDAESGPKGSQSFLEDQDAGENFVNALEENKENTH